VVVCPSCFQQFDLNQAALQRANEDVHVPVFYLSELVALAMGHEPEELGLGMHRVSVDPFFDRWGARSEEKRRLAEHFDVGLLAKCDACQACKDDCPVCKIDPAFQPNEIIADLLSGRLDDVIAEGQFWKCIECYTCQEMCHSRIGMAGVFRQLKELALERGAGPEAVAAAYAEFLKTGALGKPRESARKKLGLDPLPAGGGDAVARLLSPMVGAADGTEKE
jgi:heterodisulfide reductase subunit C